MSSSHPKPTRSRFSSPHRHSSSSASASYSRGGNNNGSRTLMQRWLEPPVQSKTSFQEAGLVRVGVLENMAPLGTMPKAAMLKKTPLCGEGSSPVPASTVKRIVLKKPFSPAVGAGVLAATTPSATATPPDITYMSLSESAGMMDDAAADADADADASLSPTLHFALPIPVVDDMDDDDYVPKKSKARRNPQNAGHPNASSTSATPMHPRRQSHRHRTREPDDKEQADKIVEIAVEEALRHFRYPTAWALRLLYDEHSGDPHFVSMIEDVYYQRATPKTIRKFRRLISEKKKEGKKENKGYYYFVPPSTGGHSTPHKPAPAPYENLIKMEFASLLRDTASDVEAEVDADGHFRTIRRAVIVTRAFVRTAALLRTSRQEARKCARAQSAVPHPSHRSPIDAIEDYDDFMGSVDGDLGAPRMEDEHAEGNNAQIPAGSMQPISVEQAKPAIKKQIVSPNPASEQNTPTTHYPHSRDSSMPAAVITSSTTTTTIIPNGTHRPLTNQTIPPLKFQSRFGDFDESTDIFIQKKLSRKSETAVNTKAASVESFIREPCGLDELLDEPDSLPQPPAPPPERGRLSRTPAPALTGRAARAAKRNHDEFDDASSPTVSSFRADFEPSSARNSRAATPTNPRYSKKPRGGLRVKTSPLVLCGLGLADSACVCARPMKKKGTSAGIPRGNGERPSPVGNGIPNNQDDNDDSCYACGGNGELGHIPDEWFCNECQIRYHPPIVNEQKGIFGALITNLQRKNPRAFRLPEPIREHFEGVKTGAEGEYEEVVPPKPKANKKNAEEAFVFFKVRDGDKAVLCHQCHKGVADNRPIIPCSICGLNWHLECLSPPLAVPPILRTWRCPCHVDDLLGDLPARLAPAHKYRKIKNMPVIEQGYSRGLANNGWIEIEEDDSDDDDEAAWKEKKAFGRVFRLSAKGIKQDFISRIHQNRGESNVQPGTVANPASTVTLKPPSLEEQRAALTLLQLAEGQGDGLHQLARAMMSQASSSSFSMTAWADAQRIAGNSLADADVPTLEAVLAQADALKQTVSKILEGRTHHAYREKSDTELKALTPNSISHDDSTVVDELKLDRASSHDTEKAQDIDDTKLALDSAMHID
ncbi:hypothetical protein CIB48_g7286 [Xylaria polymorpha]|nr:hypothetical protein CIB48_g7286 [Xylaria polymorpha]